MKKNSIVILITFIVLSALHVGYAQNSDSIQNQYQALRDEINTLKPGNTNFMLRGYGHFGLNASKEQVTFTAGSFNPIFLWRQGDRFIFESEWELEYDGNNLNIGLEYTDVSYIVSKGLIFRAGKFLLPFGTFTDRLHPAWINRFASKPLGFGHGGISPVSDVGIEVRGGLQAGKSKFNYALYLVNGPTLNDGTEEAEEAGLLHFNNMTDNNKNKAFGGRVGFLPFLNSSLEVGVSGYFGRPGRTASPFVGNSTLEDINYKNVKSDLTAFDLSYVKAISGIRGILDIKGQYNSSKTSNAIYYNSEDSTRYTFNNSSNAFYGQVSYRPALAGNEILKNFELVGRYSEYNKPSQALWGGNQKQWAFGLNYWFTWRTLFKITYQTTDTDKEGTTSSMNQFFAHIAVGF